MLAKVKEHKIIMWLIALLALCGIAIAASDLMGQSNKTCADAGINGAKMELASLDTIKQSESNPVNWQQERKLRKAIDAADKKYSTLAQKASAEVSSSGEVTASTRKAGLDCAQQYKAASETYAKFWDDNNGKTRARLAREAGEARVKNADMLFNKIDADKIEAYNDQMESLADARKAYLEEAKTDVSAKDRAAIKADLTPRLQALTSDFVNLANMVTNLISQVKDQVGSGDIGGLVSCTRQAILESDSDNPVMALLSPLTELLSLTQSLVSDAKTLASDIADIN